MNEETAKKNIGSYFTMKNRKCQVLKVKKISGVLHYGFVIAEPFFYGWIPVDFVGQCEW